MKVTIKEAHAMAKATLSGYRVEVSAKIGRRWDGNTENISWNISAYPEEGDGKNIYEDDELFSVALAKAVAEAERAKAKPADDVEIEQTSTEPEAVTVDSEPEEPARF